MMLFIFLSTVVLLVDYVEVSSADSLNVTCGPDEEFTSCANPGCGRSLCSQNFTLCADQIDESKCVPGCKCKFSYLRTDDGKCVPEHECPRPSYVTCGPDEEYNACTNGGCDKWRCGAFGILCIDLVPGACQPGCKCKPPLLRTDDGKCVPEDQCPPPQCGTNEEFVECEDSVCRPQYCSYLDGPLGCEEDVANNNTITCQRPACVCKEGFVRDNNDGTCIPIEQCRLNITCGPEEEFDSCASGGCGRSLCSQNYTSCADPIDESKCVPGCRCKDGKVKTDDGKCVPDFECPQPECGTNEEFVECKDSICRPQYCLKVDSPMGCEKDAANNNSLTCNRPGCVCQEGFVRDDKYGTCIPIQQCRLNITCGPEDEFDSCANGVCGRTFCSQNYTFCRNPAGESRCVPGCRCKNWEFKTDDGKCVPDFECPQPSYITCGPDEEYNSCVSGGCGRWMCAQSDIFCVNLISGACDPGCRCKQPLLRTDDGKCVPEDQCPPP